MRIEIKQGIIKCKMICQYGCAFFDLSRGLDGDSCKIEAGLEADHHDLAPGPSCPGPGLYELIRIDPASGRPVLSPEQVDLLGIRLPPPEDEKQRQYVPVAEVEAMRSSFGAMERAGAEQASRADENLREIIALRAENERLKKGMEAANKIAQMALGDASRFMAADNEKRKTIEEGAKLLIECREMIEKGAAENERLRGAVDDLLPLAYEAAEWAEDHTEEGDCECACCRIMNRARAALEGPPAVYLYCSSCNTPLDISSGHAPMKCPKCGKSPIGGK